MTTKPTMRYADGTSVSEDKSIRDIKAVLSRYNAAGFGYAEAGGKFSVVFEMHEKRVRFTIPLPSISEFYRTPSGRVRPIDARQPAQRAEIRRRYRALLLVIKAKLESIAAGIETFEESFMAQLVLPNGRTMSEEFVPQIGAGKWPQLGDGK